MEIRKNNDICYDRQTEKFLDFCHSHEEIAYTDFLSPIHKINILLMNLPTYESASLACKWCRRVSPLLSMLSPHNPAIPNALDYIEDIAHKIKSNTVIIDDDATTNIHLENISHIARGTDHALLKIADAIHFAVCSLRSNKYAFDSALSIREAILLIPFRVPDEINVTCNDMIKDLMYLYNKLEEAK